ncbi:MAG: ABC transporter permease [Bacillota bacterium]
MSLLEGIRVAVLSIASNKMRSGLTMLGVIIGVAAVVIMVAIGEGANLQVSAQIERLGSNLLIVMPGRTREPGLGVRGAFGSLNVLTMAEVEAIRDQCPSVLNVAPEISRSVSVKYGSGSVQTQVVATTPDYLPVRAFNVASGTFFTAEDVRMARKVAVVGQGVVDELFAGVDPIGQEIKIGHVRLRVIGVMEAKGQSGFINVDDAVYIPITTAQRRILGTDYIRTIYVQARDAKSMGAADDEITSVLTARLGGTEEFSVRNQADILSAAQDVTRVFTLLLAGIASVSLLVGGIGIMNIMLVSVTERTREIGIRKAVGARTLDILFQFLIESVVLSLLGGAIGIVLGILGAKVAARVAGWPAAVSMGSVVVPFCFALAVGLFFGMYPASRAGRLNPVEALRYE